MSLRPTTSLFVVATPIGNLKDITLRAVQILGSVDWVLSESRLKTGNLVAHFGIKAKIASFREGNARRMIPKVLEWLASGQSVALVSEAGTPGVSDPGRDLVSAARQAGFSVVPVPGPSAAVAAVSVSGMRDSRFVFEGFLPRKDSRRRGRLREMAAEERPMVFYEAPHRLRRTLTDMRNALGNRSCVVARELTKVHEEILEGDLAFFIEKYKLTEPIGEFVVVCEGAKRDTVRPDVDAVVEEARALLASGVRQTVAAKTVAARHSLRASDVYKLITQRIKAKANQSGSKRDGTGHTR